MQNKSLLIAQEKYLKDTLLCGVYHCSAGIIFTKDDIFKDKLLEKQIVVEVAKTKRLMFFSGKWYFNAKSGTGKLSDTQKSRIAKMNEYWGQNDVLEMDYDIIRENLIEYIRIYSESIPGMQIPKTVKMLKKYYRKNIFTNIYERALNRLLNDKDDELGDILCGNFFLDYDNGTMEKPTSFSVFCTQVVAWCETDKSFFSDDYILEVDDMYVSTDLLRFSGKFIEYHP